MSPARSRRKFPSRCKGERYDRHRLCGQKLGHRKGERLLFRISADLKHFRALTTGKTVVMGKNTLLSLPGGRPLPNRRNLVVSTTMAPREGVEVARSVGEAAALAGEDAVLMGGAQLYRALLPALRARAGDAGGRRGGGGGRLLSKPRRRARLDGGDGGGMAGGERPALPLCRLRPKNVREQGLSAKSGRPFSNAEKTSIMKKDFLRGGEGRGGAEYRCALCQGRGRGAGEEPCEARHHRPEKPHLLFPAPTRIGGRAAASRSCRSVSAPA